MTHRAIRWESAGLVIRVGRGTKIRTVAIDAIRGKSRILIVRMTLVTRNSPVRPREGEFRVVVRKCGETPDGRCVACLAVRREPSSCVRRIRCRSKLCSMTRVAIRWS